MQLNYKSFGEGEPILILHGMFGTLDNWQTLAKKLSAHYMVFILDLRNHGRSPHDEAFSYKIMAEDVREFMEAHWIYEATIVGHSMGGKVAMRLALEYPDSVKKLVVVDMAPKNYTGGHEAIFEALFALDLEHLESRRQADEFLKARIPEFGVRQFLLKNLSINKETQKYEWKMNLPVIYKAYTHILSHDPYEHTYTGPTLFLRGEKSRYVAEEEMDQYRTWFSEAQLATIKDAGHWVHAEQPKAFLETLQTFLENN